MGHVRTVIVLVPSLIGSLLMTTLVTRKLLLVLLELHHLGLPQTALLTLLHTWGNTIHHVKTVYGVSTTTHQNCKEVHLFGPGQGSTLGPFLLLLLFTLTVTSTLSNDWENHQNAELNSFVLLTRLSQHWDNLFFATDGALSLNKSFLVFPFFGLG